MVKKGGFSREQNQSINGFIADGEGVGANFRKSFTARVDLCMRRGKRFGEREIPSTESMFIAGKRIGRA